MMTDVAEAPPRLQHADPSASCTCGSGITARNCCGLTADRIDRGTAERFGAQLERMERAFEQGERASARAIAVEIIEASPGQPEALLMLHQLLREDPQSPNAAGAVINRAAQIHPNDATLRNAAAQFLHRPRRRGRVATPRAHARAPRATLLGGAPADGAAFLIVNNGQAAEHHLRRALELARDGRFTPTPLDARTIADMELPLAQSLHMQGRTAEARAQLSDVAGRHGPNLGVLLYWASLEEADRQFDVAEALLEQAEKLAPNGPRIAMARAGLYRRRRQPEAALSVLQSVAERRGEDGDELLQKGQVLDSLCRYDEAFAAFAKYKQFMRDHGHAYLADEANRLVESLRGFFTPLRSPMLPRADVRTDCPQPIFIVGFPRSGTTLIEQSLSLHPCIAAGDELQLIHQLADRSQMMLGSPGRYPLSLSELWLGDRAGPHQHAARRLPQPGAAHRCR